MCEFGEWDLGRGRWRWWRGGVEDFILWSGELECRLTRLGRGLDEALDAEAEEELPELESSDDMEDEEEVVEQLELESESESESEVESDSESESELLDEEVSELTLDWGFFADGRDFEVFATVTVDWASFLLSSLAAKIFSAIPFLLKNSSGISTDGASRAILGLSSCWVREGRAL